MEAKKKIYLNYTDLGIRWNYKKETAAACARGVVRRHNIPKTKLGAKKVLFHIRDIINFEQQKGRLLVEECVG